MEEFLEEMGESYDVVDSEYDSRYIFGPHGSQILLRHAARSSVHEFPFGMGILTGMPACANGACMEGFPGSSSPLSTLFFLNNVPQSKKSQVNSALSKIGKEINSVLLKRAKKIIRETKNFAGRPGDNGDPAEFAEIRSALLTSFTEAEFFHRCGSDWQQLKFPDPEPGFDGRFGNAMMLAVDEGYKVLGMLAVTHTPNNSKNSQSGSVPDAASEFNRLMQTGHACLVTKTGGSFGEGDKEPVGLGGGGNVHPSMWLQAVRGTIGNHHAAQIQRLLVGTGRPIQSHESLPSALVTPEDFKRWVWSPLLKVMLPALGLPPGSDEVSTAQNLFGGASREVSDDEGQDDGVYIPDSKGYFITLADGVETRLRFKAEGSNFIPEFRVANRDIPIQESEEVEAIARKVLEYFSSKNQTIPLEEDARALFKGFSACFEAQVAVARANGNMAVAAQCGTGPWHTLMLSGCLLCFEIGIGHYDNSTDPVVQEQFRTRTLPVRQHHIVRAYHLVQLFHKLAKTWAGKRQTNGSRPEFSQNARQSDMVVAQQRLASVALGGMAPRSQFREFALTQASVGGNTAADSSPVGARLEAVLPSQVHDDASTLTVTKLCDMCIQEINECSWGSVELDEFESAAAKLAELSSHDSLEDCLDYAQWLVYLPQYLIEAVWAMAGCRDSRNFPHQPSPEEKLRLLQACKEKDSMFLDAIQAARVRLAKAPLRPLEGSVVRPTSEECGAPALVKAGQVPEAQVSNPHAEPQAEQIRVSSAQPGQASPTQDSSLPDAASLALQGKDVLKLGDPELPPMSEGYGQDGASVQDPMHGDIVFSDREIMQKTLLRGEPCIFGFQVIDSNQVRQKTGATKIQRTSIKMAHWKAVMAAGLGKFRVGAYSDGTDCTDQPRKARIYLELPANDSPELTKQFHNRLMMLCQLPLVTLSDCILKRQSKPTKSARPHVAKTAEAPEAGGGPSQRGSCSVVAGPSTAQDIANAATPKESAKAAASSRPFERRLRSRGVATEPVEFPEQGNPVQDPAAVIAADRAAKVSGGSEC